MNKLEQKIVRWMRQQIKESGTKGIVLGLSGGVDSSVVAVLGKKAVGSNLLALILPCKSNREDIKDAQLVVRQFKIKSKFIDLGAAYESLLKILPKAKRLAQANLKARLRMLTLYYFANKLNYLVAGTGNKSELMMGYFTKYGDGGVDILPIGGLFKTEVRKLAKQLKIPQRIISKPPTAGLWPGQTDEAEMGISYIQLDEILKRIEKKSKQLLSASKVRMVKERIKMSCHKRKTPRILY
jgi:NAD+ synthase